MSSEHQVIRLPNGVVQLCPEYQKNFRCSNYECCDLHICPAYLAGHCKYGDADCKHHHKCRVAENRTIIQRHRLDAVNCDENLREIFNTVLPKVCLDYQSKEGCKRGDRCNFLHLCGRFAKGKCSYQACEMLHEYKTGPNRRIIDKYNLDLQAGDSCLINAIMADGRFSKNMIRCSCRKDKFSSMDSLSSDTGDRGQRDRGRGRGGQRGGRGGNRGRGGGHGPGQQQERQGSPFQDRGERHMHFEGGDFDPRQHDRQGWSGPDRGGRQMHYEDGDFGRHQQDRQSWSGPDRGGRQMNRGGRGGGPHQQDRQGPSDRGGRQTQHGGRGQGPHQQDRRGPPDRGGSQMHHGGRGQGPQQQDRRGPPDRGEIQMHRGGRGQGPQQQDRRGPPDRGGRQTQHGQRGGRGNFRGNGTNLNRSVAASMPQLNQGIIPVAGNEDGKKSGRPRQRRRGGRGRQRQGSNASTDQTGEQSDSDNEAYPDEEIDSDTDLYSSNVEMLNVKKDVKMTNKDLVKLRGQIQAVSKKIDNLDLNTMDEEKTNMTMKTVASSDDSEVKAAVFDYLIQRGGWVPFSKMRADLQLVFPADFDLEAWLLRHENGLILNKDSNGQLIDVAPFMTLRICFKYNSAVGCDRSETDCKYLHVCKDFITGVCGDRCQYSPQRNHHLQDPGTQSILSKLNIGKLKTKVCCGVIAATLPQICPDYNQGGCVNSTTCSKLHVCQMHLLGGKCTKQNCISHDVKTKFCVRILKRYHLQNENISLLRNMILPGVSWPEGKCDADRKLSDTGIGSEKQQRGARPKAGQRTSPDPEAMQKATEKKESKRSRGQNKKKDSQSQDTEAELCEPYLRGACNKCSLRHHSLPFLWQYQFDGQWRDFEEEFNIAIEREFCDVTSSRWNISIHMSLSESLGMPFCGSTSILFQKDPMELQSLSYGGPGDLSDEPLNLPVRRLSTLSHVNAERFKTLATVWHWYYYMNDTWRTNEESDSHQAYLVERRYLKGNPNHTFREEQLCIEFQQMPMLMVDLQTGETVAVRRRPVFRSKDDVAEKLRSARAKLVLPQLRSTKQTTFPEYWSEMAEDDSYKIVALSPGTEFAGIEQSFRKSMGQSVEIKSIHRIQNTDLWSGYTTQKQKISTDPGKRLEEKYYFYVCESDMYDFVQKYGLITSKIVGDGSPIPDLGTGFYFSKDARLLHEVSMINPGESKMFLCKILIGSRQVGPMGDAYSRTVYDTFTNEDETIILKVEIQDCYPEYEICYKMVESPRGCPDPGLPQYAPDVIDPPPSYQQSVPVSYPQPQPNFLAHVAPSRVPRTYSEPTADDPLRRTSSGTEIQYPGQPLPPQLDYAQQNTRDVQMSSDYGAPPRAPPRQEYATPSSRDAKVPVRDFVAPAPLRQHPLANVEPSPPRQYPVPNVEPSPLRQYPGASVETSPPRQYSGANVEPSQLRQYPGTSVKPSPPRQHPDAKSPIPDSVSGAFAKQVAAALAEKASPEDTSLASNMYASGPYRPYPDYNKRSSPARPKRKENECVVQ